MLGLHTCWGPPLNSQRPRRLSQMELPVPLRPEDGLELWLGRWHQGLLESL